MKWFALLTLVLSLNSAAQDFQPAIERSRWTFSSIAGVPIQSGGRVKPLDSFAREVVLFVTGKRSFGGWRPTELILSWMTSPKYWNDQKFIRVGHPDVRKQLLLPADQVFYSPSELSSNSILGQYVRNVDKLAFNDEEKVRKPRENELKQTVNRLMTYRGVVSGQLLTLVPQKDSDKWLSIAPTEKKVEGHPIQTAFKELVRAYYFADEPKFYLRSSQLAGAIHKELDTFNKPARGIAAETFYNSFRPFLWAWVIYLLASLFLCASILVSSRKAKLFGNIGLVGSILGLSLHLLGFVLRIYIAGRPPVSNMYESIIWVSFGALLFALFLFWRQKQTVVLAVGNAVAALCLIAGDAAPAVMDPSIQPLVPVLRSNLWLTVHVLTITLGYSAFLLSFGLGNLTLYHYMRDSFGHRASLKKIDSLNQLTYRSMQFGVVLLAAGTILGGVWADYSWGRFWGWDPKEVWALIALLAYLVILHGRFAGWVGSFGFAAWSVLCFLTVVMAWYGVNFVLGVGLHSYGFTAGGGYSVGFFALLQLAYVGAVYALRFRKNFAK